MARAIAFDGFLVSKYGDGVYRLEIYPPEAGDESYGPGVWVDGDMADDIDGTMEDFISKYGSQVLDYMPDFATGRIPEARHISEVWPK